LLLAGGSLNALLWGMIAGFSAILVISYVTASSLCGRVCLWPLWPGRQDLAVLAPFAGLLLLSNLTLVLRDNTDKILLASLGSPTMAGQFAIAQRFSSIIMQMGWTVCLPLTASVGSLYAARNWTAIRQLYSHVSTWLVVATGLAGFLICTLREPLLVLWLGEDQPQAHGYLVMLVFGVTSALAFTGAGVALVKGVGRPGLETAYMVITLALIVITKPLLIAVLGAVGCVISSAASWCLGGICFLFMLHRRLDLPREILTRSIGIFLVTIAASAISWALTSRHPMSSSGRPEAAMLLTAAMLPLVACYLGLLSLFRLIPTPLSMIAALRTYQVGAKETNA
jgi:O-antigen/teichoic acid export membrane protein